MLPSRSQLHTVTLPDAFYWATGIEDTFITDPWPATGRTLDEYELTGHYSQLSTDLELMASLRVKCARYGIPWHRIQPAEGEWDWSFPDEALNRMWDLGVEPILDLVHYGLPPWIENAYLHPRFGDLMGEYARRVAERYQGRLRWYTPLNEPRITAYYCGKLGWWPPNRRGWRGFTEVMLGLCRGMVQARQAFTAVDPETVAVHVDATDVYTTSDPSLQPQVEVRQHIGFLALDLVSGRVNREHPLHGWLLKLGAKPEQLEWFLEHGSTPEIVGMNMYPMFSGKLVVRSGSGVRMRMPYQGPELVEKVARLYAEHCPGTPLMITETAARGTYAKRQAWLDGSVESIRRLREDSIPVIGYTWWPMFALVAWAYRQSQLPAERYLEQMGLWDLQAEGDGTLRRVSTPVVDRYRALVSMGTQSVGALAASSSSEGVRPVRQAA